MDAPNFKVAVFNDTPRKWGITINSVELRLKFTNGERELLTFEKEIGSGTSHDLLIEIDPNQLYTLEGTVSATDDNSSSEIFSDWIHLKNDTGPQYEPVLRLMPHGTFSSVKFFSGSMLKLLTFDIEVRRTTKSGSVAAKS